MEVGGDGSDRAGRDPGDGRGPEDCGDALDEVAGDATVGPPRSQDGLRQVNRWRHGSGPLRGRADGPGRGRVTARGVTRLPARRYTAPGTRASSSRDSARGAYRAEALRGIRAPESKEA